VTDRWTPSQLTGTLRWVLSLEYAGGTWYLGQESITIDDGTGGTIVISDGLLDLADTTETLDLWSTDSPRRSVPVEFDLGVDVATLIEQGHDLAGCVAELAQLADGDDWSARRPFVVGRLQEPQYGADGEGVRASIEQDVLSSDETIEVSTVIGQDVLDVLVATGTYIVYVIDPTAGLIAPTYDHPAPVIIGTPGGGTTSGSRTQYVAYVEDASSGAISLVFLLAGHAVAATSVTLTNTNDGTSGVATVRNLTVSNTQIAIGLYALAAATLNYLGPITATWDTGGGLLDETGGVLQTAGDYLAYLLRLTEQQVDHGRTNAARDALRAFRVGTYLDESTVIADYIREAMLDIVPVSLAVGPRGVYPYVWRWDASSEDAVAHFDVTEDPDIEREGLVTYEDADRIVNTLQLLYKWNPQTEAYGAEIWAVGDPASRPRGLRFGGSTATLTRSYWADPVLATSVGRYGIRRETLETAIVADVLTAEHVLAWRSRRWALPSRVVEYTCPQRWAWIEPGDFVTVTDPELAWSERLCLIQSRAWASDGSVRYTLRVQEG
jgi:hypothetical protein